MIQMINKLKKNQKGFTLVELIVVLVILAILAAFTIPAMLGFVNDARAKAYVSEARELKLAYQSAVTEVITKNDNANTEGTAGTGGGTNSGGVNGLYSNSTATTGDALANKVQKQAFTLLIGDIVKEESNGTLSVGNGSTFYVKVEDGKVTKIDYHRGDYTVTLTENSTDTKKESTITSQSGSFI
ncbi:MAG: hypothetical protein EUB_01827 [Eubacterium sp.]|uniref:pilus assembly FimT family protein n=1 Tax=Eubacterium sp. TaxID=142586 RepID=UPI00304A21CA